MTTITLTWSEFVQVMRPHMNDPTKDALAHRAADEIKATMNHNDDTYPYRVAAHFARLLWSIIQDTSVSLPEEEPFRHASLTLHFANDDDAVWWRLKHG